MTSQGRVFIIAIDDAVRDSLSLLLESSGFSVAAFATYDALPRNLEFSGRSSLVIDIHGDDDAPFELLDRLRSDQPHIPVVVMTSATGDRRLVRRQQHFSVLEKPQLGGAVVEAVRAAMARFGH